MSVSEIYVENVAAVSEPGKDAGVTKGKEDQAMPIIKKGTGDPDVKDTETKGEMSQAAGQELHPRGTMVKDKKSEQQIAAVSNQGDGGQQAGEQSPAEVATKAIEGLFK